MRMVVKINPKGGFMFLHKDESCPLLEAGDVQIKRASLVEYNNVKRCWEVLTPKTRTVLMTGFQKRSEAIDAEVWFLENIMEILDRAEKLC